MRALLGGFSLAVLLSGSGFCAASLATRSEGVQFMFPEGLKTEPPFRYSDRMPRPTGRALLRVDQEGTPYILAGRMLVAAKRSDDGQPDAFSLGKGAAVSDFVWMSDGVMLFIEESRLMTVTKTGPEPVQVLAGPGMRMAPAEEDSIYLFGGDDPEQKKKLYIYKAGGRLLFLMKTESPISAVAGDGKVTFVAIDKAVYRLELGAKLTAALITKRPITSLTLGPKSTFFYSTPDGAGFSDGRHGGRLFVVGEDAEAQVRGESFYLFFPKELLVIRGRPVGSFLKTFKTGPAPARTK